LSNHSTDWVERLRSEGETQAEALEELRQILLRGLSKSLTRRGGGDAFAEDIVQQALVKILNGLDSFEGRSRFTTWLFRITVNEASSWSRLASRRARRLAQGVTSRGHAEAPDEREDARRLAELALSLFRDLPRRQREILDLVDLQGFAPAEAAEMLDMNPNTVRANLFKARRALRARTQPWLQGRRRVRRGPRVAARDR